MRKLASLLALVATAALGCANGGLVDEDASSPNPTSDAGKDATLLDVSRDGPAQDTGVPDTQPPDSGCPQNDAGLGGVMVPPGSTATATTSFQANTPDLAIDGDPGTYWNAGGFTGSITVAFPSAVLLDGVRFVTVASPNASETYTIYGITGGNSAMIGAQTLAVPAGASLAAPISVTQGTYDGIRVDISSSGSWAALAEISILTPQCP